MYSSCHRSFYEKFACLKLHQNGQIDLISAPLRINVSIDLFKCEIRLECANQFLDISMALVLLLTIEHLVLSSFHLTSHFLLLG